MSDEVETLILRAGCRKLVISLGPLRCLYSVLIARLINLYGDAVEEIRCPLDSAYIAALRVPYWPTHAGEIVSVMLCQFPEMFGRGR